MSDTTRVVVRLRPDIASEEAGDIRARAWAYVFKCFHRHKEDEGGPETAPDAGKEILERSGKTIVPQ